MDPKDARIVYLTAGAAGMYCGSCLHDNALTRALVSQGWNVQLVPTYTPIRTDETDVSVDHVLLGGLNVYLQQKIPLFRYVPAALDHFLDSPALIRRLTARSFETDPRFLGSLTWSMLNGVHGNQHKEVRRMTRWLKRDPPDLIILTNLLIGGCIEHLKSKLGVPVLVTLQGDNLFLDNLKPPWKDRCMQAIKQIAQRVDGFIVHSPFFREMMSDYFEIDPGKILVTPLGIDTRDYRRFLPGGEHQRSPSSENTNLGYLARLAPEKGLHHLVDAFLQLKSNPANAGVRLKIAGWLGPPHLDYAQQQWDRLFQAGLGEHFHYAGTLERQEKLEFLNSIDIFSVPVDYAEPKAIYALEALAAGLPLVQPNLGVFPELIEQSGGGLIFQSGNTLDYARNLESLIRAPKVRRSLGHAGQTYVHRHRNAQTMATTTGDVLQRFLKDRES